MTKIHLHSHMAYNFVRVGDKVEKYKTKIGTIGNANSSTSWNNMYAHDHLSISIDLTPTQIHEYIYGWTLDKVKQYYLDPRNENIDFTKVYPNIKNVDVGNRGYNFLQSIKNSKGSHIGFHPAIDFNNSIGGDTDFGEDIMASCNGTVIAEWRGWTSNGGWGNEIYIEVDEDNSSCEEELKKIDEYQDKLEQAQKDYIICMNK